MMITSLLILSFFSFTVGTEYPPNPICSRANEEFLLEGTACQPTCDNRNPGCTKNLVSGCFCKAGYIRDNDRDQNCIPIEECPQECKNNEEFKTCAQCDKTCENLNRVCATEVCRVGCFCKEGFVRDAEDNCIRPENCPTCNGENEEYKFRGTPCQATCDKRDAPLGCTKNYVSGCFCKAGYIRDNDKDKNCIPIEHCPRECKPNEEFTTCGGCNTTCDTLNSSCAAVCRVGCFCKKGYVRDANGNCILIRDCPQKKCDGPFEEYSKCAVRCPPNARCPQVCTPGCVCKKGFTRRNGVCVKNISIPSPRLTPRTVPTERHY